MKGQFSRLTARRARRYSSVRLQQGRVHLDSDFNEQVDIATWRDRVTTHDVVGPSGAPVDDGGFGLSAVVSLTGLDGEASVFRAVGTRGTVLVTQDGGSTWALQTVPAPAGEHDLTAIDQHNNKNSMAVTTAGEVLVQSNSSTWAVVTPPEAGGLPLLGVHLLSPSTAWVVGSEGRILGSVDGGGAWTRKTAAGVSETLRAVHFPTSTDGWAVGDGGRIVRTADAGATWAAQATPPEATSTLRSVRFASDALHGWAVGDGATILSTADGGTTWLARTAPAGTDATLRAVDAVSTTTAWAVGDAGTVMRTTDGGGTWEAIAPDVAFAGADLTAVRASAANAASVAGDRSTLASVTLTGGGVTWQAATALPGRDLAIGAGRLYVDGILVENDRPARLLAQPDLLDVSLPGAGTYRAYLDVWTRHLTALERPELREVALGGPDTATRTQTVWQVRIDPTSLPPATTCADTPDGWTPVAVPAGRLRARGAPMPVSTNDCLVPAGGGYRRLENQLYRVEVHAPGAAGTATYKWSRDNGSVAARLTGTDPAAAAKTVTIADPGRAPGGDFAGAAWVELTDDRRVLAGEPGVLLAVHGVTGTVIALQTAPPAMAGFGAGALVRRWDGTGTVTAGGWKALATTDAAVAEDGIEVEFAPGTYASGDHWTMPARSLTGDVEWPRSGGVASFLPRDGVEHRWSVLGIVAIDAGGGVTVVEDCRTRFPPLTGLETLLYVGGDGQEVPGGGSLLLPDPAVVAVMRGPIPVAHARVLFRADSGGTLTTGAIEQIVPTDADGRALVMWTLANADGPQHLTAQRIDDADQPYGNPVQLQARIRSAASVSYDPTCPDLTGATTVQAAIDALCKRPTGTGGGCCHTVGKGVDELGEFPDLLTALKELIGRGHVHVCLCLLPGDHEVDGDALRDMLMTGVVQDLEIGGRGARIITGTGLVFAALARVTLRDVVVETRDVRALSFVGDPGLDPDDRMRVDLLDVTVLWVDAPPEAELVTFDACGRVDVRDSTLSVMTPADTKLKQVLPARVAAFFEQVPALEGPKLQAALGKLLGLADAQRLKLAQQVEAAVAKQPQVFTPDRAPIVLDFNERLRAGTAGMPSAAQLKQLRLDWVAFASSFGATEAWPAAIVFHDTAADATVATSRLDGGIALRAAGRSLPDEVKAESPFRLHDVVTVPGGSGRLRLDGNVLDWLGLGAEAARSLAEHNGDVTQAELLPVLFAELLVNGNTFRSAPHVLLATATTITGNVFETSGEGATAPRLGFVASAVASATGNLGPEGSAVGVPDAELVLHGNAAAQAGNARLTIV